MRHTTVFFLAAFIIISLYTGCQFDGRGRDSHPSRLTDLKVEKEISNIKVTTGGKTWEINPNRSYYAVGIWRNPNPRPLTDTEKTRLKSVQTHIQNLQAQLQNLEAQLEKYHKESDALLRIKLPEIKIRYDFGLPPHMSSEEIIGLGEFPMEIEDFTPKKIK